MKIISKTFLVNEDSLRIVSMQIESKDIAAHAKAGNFVVIMVNEFSERIPLTIVNADYYKGIITVIFQEIGFSTKLLGKLNVGDNVYAITGPLGNSTEIKSYGKVLIVAGGVGAAECLPVAKALKEAGNDITIILGAKTKSYLILADELKKTSNNFFISTDDGSAGLKGFTTDVISGQLKLSEYDFVYLVGPVLMMKSVALLTKKERIKTVASLEALMVDATGMCGCCRVTVDGEIKFSCIDGPEFDAHLVDWDKLISRNNMYKENEKHICKLKKL